MHAQLRIIAGSLRGRKLKCDVHAGLRPTPDMVRQALFSILGNAVPGRPFFDLFAGTGVIGLEAISRGAREAILVERDFRLVEDIQQHVRQFVVTDKANVIRGDVYRWAERWDAPDEAVTLFLSPPFADLENSAELFLNTVEILRRKMAPDSVLVLQMEDSPALSAVQDLEQWDVRRYGRNYLLIWVKETEVET